MARLLQAGRRAFSSSSFFLETLILQRNLPHKPMISQFQNPLSQSRNYIAEMRKSAFDSNILRILRNEIQYELEYAPPNQPVTEFNSFTIEDKPGEQWIRLRSKNGDEEEIKIEVTMFDGSVPASKSGENDPQLHISLIIDVSKGKECDVLEFVCSAWPDCLEIQKVFMLRPKKMSLRPYLGPDFNDLDDEVQDALQEFLEVRGVNDDLAVFLHQYMMNKDKTEFIHWMATVKKFIEK